MPPGIEPMLLARLGALRAELIDLAYDLDVRGAHAAADVAMTTSARLAELCGEFASSCTPPPSAEVSEAG